MITAEGVLVIKVYKPICLLWEVTETVRSEHMFGYSSGH